MNSTITRWFLTAIILLLLDFIYLSATSGFFQSMIQSIQCGKKMEIRIEYCYSCVNKEHCSLYHLMVMQKVKVLNCQRKG